MKHRVKIFDIKQDDMIVDSDYMKIIVASFFRYNRQCKYTAIEFQRMDICAISNDNIIEIECKISKNDLKHELSSPTKKLKHYNYKNNHNTKYHVVPNSYYFAIPRELYNDKECVNIINSINEKYGIIVVDDWLHIDIVKYAVKLHDKKIPANIKDNISARISSDNIMQRIKHYKKKSEK